MESDKHITKHTRATIRTIDQYLSEEGEKQPRMGHRTGLGLKK